MFCTVFNKMVAWKRFLIYKEVAKKEKNFSYPYTNATKTDVYYFKVSYIKNFPIKSNIEF